MKLVINITWVIILTFISVGYLSLAADHIPPKYALMINIIIFPLVLGFVGGWVIQTPLYVKFIVLLIIPVTHVLYFGGDPGKPGLENLVAIVEAISIWGGVLIFYLVDKFIFEKIKIAGVS